MRLTLSTTLAVLITVVVEPGVAQAWCPEPKPSVREEASASDYVLKAIVSAERVVPEAGKSYDGWSYRLKPLQIFRGRVHAGSEVFTENTSGRLPLEVGAQYLLFAKRNSEGRLEITNCGHSGLVSQRVAEIALLEKKRGK
jgi:hypothetical protein